MANIVFQGPAALTLDTKGRIAMPARHRVLLEAMRVNQMTITKHPDGCLMIFPRPIWETFRDHVAALPMDAVKWKRVFLGNAMDADIDNSGRLLIAPELRAATGLVRDVMLLGMGNHLELWDAQKHAELEAEVMKSEMPESLKTFSF
ncbi:MAG: division/cell wall cluster transcriptional repressor MraZ [Piscinibacter sp.]|nr:division/cell wall cluster transcriptional repressor MraZ [Piscinibacter sp.]